MPDSGETVCDACCCPSSLCSGYGASMDPASFCSELFSRTDPNARDWMVALCCQVLYRLPAIHPARSSMAPGPLADIERHRNGSLGKIGQEPAVRSGQAVRPVSTRFGGLPDPGDLSEADTRAKARHGQQRPCKCSEQASLICWFGPLDGRPQRRGLAVDQLLTASSCHHRSPVRCPSSMRFRPMPDRGNQTQCRKASRIGPRG
jgi:hypothetical protein